ncbi:cupin [Lentzea sp. NBRC 105346]|uniref:cupin domain-containing protein n=1 Tax=Lentzea sp. NBRC 105346 TaxID=3032205 RepID=UPI0024A2D3FB|nr:cupin domain-containing protein [Lentzea sp. NBRC 105346]GLZ28429.1 cupin [Lentzea sp. NBRC 105346]
MDKCVLIRSGTGAPGSTGVTYAPGVSADSAGARGLCLELATLPPGARAKAHLHAGHESAAYVLSGELTLWFGEHLEDCVVARAGDFLYIPAGVPHRPANASETEPAVAVLARTDPNEQESAVPLPELEERTP